MTCPVMCAYESVKRRIPRVTALSTHPFGLMPIEGENPDGISEVGIYNPNSLRGGMSVYFRLVPERSNNIDREILQDTLGDELILNNGRIQKSRFLGFKKTVAEITQMADKGKSSIIFLVKDKAGAEYLENVLEALKK